MKRIINNDISQTPNWLTQLKNSDFDDVDTTNNRAITLTDFSVDENTFEDFMHDIDKELLFVYVSTLSKEELTKLYEYLEDKGSYFEYIKENLVKLKRKSITHDMKARATLEIPLAALSSTYLSLCKNRIEWKRLKFDNHEELENITSFSARLISLKELFDYYPCTFNDADYALELTLKYVGEHKITKEETEAFIEFMSQLPMKYKLIGLKKTLALKENITIWIKQYTPYTNEALSDDNKELIKAYLYDNEHIVAEEQREAKKRQRYTLSLTEYIKLFKPLKEEADLRKADLWNHSVSIDERWSDFDGIIKDKQSGTIGWEYPVTASVFDMTVEMPVVFEKVNGDSLSVGVPLGLVLLKEY